MGTERFSLTASLPSTIGSMVVSIRSSDDLLDLYPQDVAALGPLDKHRPGGRVDRVPHILREAILRGAKVAAVAVFGLDDEDLPG